MSLCQDLSVAGKMAGMGRDSGTRSGLLWEVERLLKECDELPQVLVMENVIQVHSEGENRKNFLEWIRFLESIGYTSSWKDMNARHYGTPQNRNRCICVSILGNYKKFEFPKPFPLKVMATDLLEDEVDDKYYIRNDKSKILLDKLEDKGIILTDRQTDSSLISQLTNRSQDGYQTALLQDTTTESLHESKKALVYARGFRGSAIDTDIKPVDVAHTQLASKGHDISNLGEDLVVCKKK